MQELTDLSSASSTPSRYASAESGYSSPYEPDHPVPAPTTSDDTRILAEDVRIQARPLQLATSALHLQDLSANSKGTLREERAGERGFKCEDANYHQLYRSRSADNTPIGFAGVSWREQSASAPGSFETRPNDFSREREDKGSRQDGAPSGALVDDSHMKGAQSPSQLVLSSGIDLGASDAASQGGIESGQAIARHPTIEDRSQSLKIAYEAWKVSEQAKAHLHDSKKKLGRFLELAFRKELLCIAHVKHRYGVRSSNRVLAAAQRLRLSLYSFPRKQSTLSIRTSKLKRDWERLVDRYTLVNKLAISLCREGEDDYDGEGRSRFGSGTASPTPNACSSYFVKTSDGKPICSRSTKLLVEEVALYFEEVQVQEAIMNERAKILDAEWQLLLAQLKQLDQADLLAQAKASTKRSAGLYFVCQ